MGVNCNSWNRLLKKKVHEGELFFVVVVLSIITDTVGEYEILFRKIINKILVSSWSNEHRERDR